MTDQKENVIDLPVKSAEVDLLIEGFLKQFETEEILNTDLSLVRENLLAHAQKLEIDSENPKRQAGITEGAMKKIGAHIAGLRSIHSRVEAHSRLLGYNYDPRGKFFPELSYEYVKAWFDKFENIEELADEISWQLKNIGEKHVDEKTIAQSIKRYVRDKKIQGKAEILRSIAYNGVQYDEAIERIKAFIAPALVNGKGADITAKVLYHWIWLVKRKMLGEKTKDPIAPAFLSTKQWLGKTDFVKTLISPLTGHSGIFFESSDLEALTRTADQYEILQKFVVLVDEMAGADTVNIKKLRKVMTEDMVGVRRYGKQDYHRIKNNASIIMTGHGHTITGNLPALEGERRMFAIPVKTFRDVKASPEELRRVGHLTEELVELGVMYPEGKWNPEYFWSLVDPYLPCTLPKMELEKVQKKDRPDLGIESFCSSYRVIPGQVPFLPESVYDVYKRMRKSVGDRVIPDKQRFLDHLKEHLADAAKKMDPAPQSHGANSVYKPYVKSRARNLFRNKWCLMLDFSPRLIGEIEGVQRSERPDDSKEPGPE